MSYGISVFRREVRERAIKEGLELDEFEHPPLDPADVDRFIERLGRYGYVLESTNPVSREFVRHVNGCPIQVAVFRTEISFSIPYWNNCENAIVEARQDASELADSDSLALFDQQAGEWDE